MNKNKTYFLWASSRPVKENSHRTQLIQNRGPRGERSQRDFEGKDQFFSRELSHVSHWIFPCLRIEESKDWWGHCRWCSLSFQDTHLCLPDSFVQSYRNCHTVDQTIKGQQAILHTFQINSLDLDNWFWKAITLPSAQGWESVKANEDK